MPRRLGPWAFFLFILSPRLGQAALSVQDLASGSSPAAMVAQVLGPGVSVSNITFNGDPQSAGTFTGGSGILGFSDGIVLSSGRAVDVTGPNNVSDTSTPFNTPGDSDLNALAGAPTFDASVLEFDFVPTNPTLTFNFVFGSDEYPEYISAFNDGFGLLVNGVNAARLPGGGPPVNIFNVNSSANASYYVDNSGAAFNTQLDGFTVPIQATVSVNAGVVNHMKIAIADAKDAAVDSAVFIQAGSFIAPSPSPSPTITPTFSISPTFSVSPTFSATSTITLSETFTDTPSATPTFSATPTVTPTSTRTPTATVTPTFSASPTESPSPTVSMTPSVTPTDTETPPPLLLTLLPANPDPSDGADGTFIPYRLSTDADVSIDVWTVAGEHARHLHPGWRLRGVREDFWDQRNEAGTRVASGVFIYRVRAVSAAGEEKQDFRKCAVTR